MKGIKMMAWFKRKDIEENEPEELSAEEKERQRKLVEEYEIKRKKEQEERNRLQKEYDAIKSLCLSCQNAFIYEYVKGPGADPLYVKCKIIREYVPEDSEIRMYAECSENGWYRKCTRCSDYVNKEGAE